MSYLYLFQIGPVQSFIAQARRTQDLLVGSKMLSNLAAAGVRAAQSAPGFKPIFPVLKGNDELPASIPHMFAFLSSDPKPQAVAERVQQAIEARWREYAETVESFMMRKIGCGDWQTVYRRQAYEQQGREFYWVAVAYDSRQHSESYKRARQALNQRKQLRHFPQVEEPGRKCTLTGAQSALPLNWDALREAINDQEASFIRRNESLGSSALIKRLVPSIPSLSADLDLKRFPSTRAIAANKPNLTDDEKLERMGKDVRGYLAILHMDGDRMGQALSGLDSLEKHQRFSAALAQFADEAVPATIQTYGGKAPALIYAGGDDVLALLPLPYVLRCANEIRLVFERMVGAKMSAGIAITPYDLPLDVGLELARKAEKTAKDVYGRNALVFTEAHGTGQLRSAGAHWDEVMGMMEQAQKLFHERHISAKIAYDLQTIAHDMGGDEPKNAYYLAQARAAELRRLIKRRTAEGKPEIPDTFAQAIIDYAEARTWSDAANWLILARFLARSGQPEYDERTPQEAQP
ncbi:MAG: type III-B CRISPR-associated protein Cas10/Cmr2 [Anaerolineae bacterium]|nr:type III-B CRISPR-associated protein Cas10/Cmr2 [Anaerolineae bacterium]